MENKKISDTTIEALTRNFFKESFQYGFKYEDYLKFVNILLEYAISKKNGNGVSNSEREKNVSIPKDEVVSFPINTPNLIIREIQSELDFELINEWSKDEFGRYFLLSILNSENCHLENLLYSPKHKHGIICTKDNTPIGIVSFLNIDRAHNKAELRKLIGNAEFRARGFGKEATRYWIKYGFSKLGLKKIYLNTIDTNIHNIKINEEMGFKVEGILRNEVMIDNKTHDVLRMGLLIEE